MHVFCPSFFGLGPSTCFQVKPLTFNVPTKTPFTRYLQRSCWILNVAKWQNDMLDELLLSIYSHLGVQRCVFDRFNHIPFLPNSCCRHHDINQLLFVSCLERSCELCLRSDLNRIWGGKDGKGDHDLRFMCIVSTVPMTCWRSIWIFWTASTNINWDVLRVAGKVAIGGHMFNTVSFNPHIKRVWFVFLV